MTAAAPATSHVAHWARRAWLVALLAAIGTVVVCLLAGIVMGRSLRVDVFQKVMGVAAIAPIFCTMGLLAATVIGRRQLVGFMIAGMVVTATTMVGWMALAWSVTGGVEWGIVPIKLLVSGSLVSLWLGGCGYLLTGPRRGRRIELARRVMVTSITTFVAGGLLFLWSMWWQGRMVGPMIAIALGALGSIVGTFTLIVFSWREAARARPAGESVPRRLQLRLCCPTCDLEQVMASGLAHCRDCGTALLIEVEEPRCECGYLLYRLEGETCPECGREIPVAERWVGVGEREEGTEGLRD